MHAIRSRPRRSGIVRSTIDRSTARTRHPDPVAIDAAIKLAAVLVLLEEGGEGREQQSRPGEEIRVARRPEPTAARQPFRVTDDEESLGPFRLGPFPGLHHFWTERAPGSV